MIREKYCVDSKTKHKRKGNNWDLATSENGADRILFCEDKGSLSRRVCHCIGGGQLLRREIQARIPGLPCTTAHARAVSALSDGRQVLMPEDLHTGSSR